MNRRSLLRIIRSGRSSLVVVYLSVLCPRASAEPAEGRVGPDGIPWPPGESIEKAGAESRVRWLFRPDQPVPAEAALGDDERILRVATLARFGNLWILEADPADAAQVESTWSALGNLRRDVSGTPALKRTTALVGASTLWNASDLKGNRFGTVAILDSGCDTAHDDLGDPDSDNADNPPQAAGDADDWVDAVKDGHPIDAEIRVVGWHDVSDDMPGSAGPYDYERHGTALAGVAFGGGEVDPDYRGVAPEGRFVVIKTYNFEGVWQHWASDLLLGIDWLLTHHRALRVRAALIATNWDEDLEISAAVEQLLDAGIAVIAAAGNEGRDGLGWPAVIEDVITVGATDATGRIASYSNRSEPGYYRVDLVAPGGSLLTPDGGTVAPDNEPNDSYRGRVGTSIAAAHVAGAVSLLTQAIEESGVEWRYERNQVLWLNDLLRISAAETEGAESGAARLPSLGRWRPDDVEGHGILQLPAAADVARRTMWPGERTSIFLHSPQVSAAVWARRLPVWGEQTIRFELAPPPDSDFDLILYRETESGFKIEGTSINVGNGVIESLEKRFPGPAHYVIVVRRVRGGGFASLSTERVIEGLTRWPLQLASTIRHAPALYDLDNDGKLEIIAINNLPVDPSAHTYFVFRSNGTPYGVFPRTHFGLSQRPGAVYTPAVGDFGAGTVFVSGTAFGDVLAMSSTGTLKFDRSLSGNEPTSMAAFAKTGAAGRVVIGTILGVEILDASGASVQSWSMPGGVSRAPLLGDLDGDGQRDVVVVENGVGIHARRLDGSALAGWPVLFSATSRLSDPVGLGSGGGRLESVAFVESFVAGGSRMHLRDDSGASRPGFPVDFSEDVGATAEALGGLIATRLEHGGPNFLVAPALQLNPGGPILQGVHAFDLNGGERRWPAERLCDAAFADGTFIVNRLNFSAPRAADISHHSGAEILWSAQFAWQELELTERHRYGSVQSLRTATDAGFELRLQMDYQDGRRQNTGPSSPPATIGDLNGTGKSDVVLARNEWLHLQSGRVATVPGEYWGVVRNDPERTGCYRCGIEIPVAVVDPPSRGSAQLRVYPNPSNPLTLIELDIPVGGALRFRVVDARGRLVRSWRRQQTAPGVYRESFDGRDAEGNPLASGVYYLRVDVADQTLNETLTILR
jgi:hypothetical protein